MLILTGCGKASSKDGKSDSIDSTDAKKVKTTATEAQVKDSAIEWKDKKFEVVVRKLLNKPDGDIMTNDVRDIEKLDCSNAGIISTDDLRYFENLKEANFSHNGLVNFGFEMVNKLNQLVKLDLSYNKIESFDLSHMPNLQYINLQENKIENGLSGLAGNKELTYLNLNDAVEQYDAAMDIFGDIGALSGLTKLSVLDLGNIRTIDDYSCLSNLTNLQELNLENTNIKSENLEYIKGMKKLTKLNLKDIEYAELTKDIAELSNLKVLYAKCDDEVNDIIGNLKNMEELYLDFDDSTIELSFLKNMHNLKKLTIIGAEIEDPSPLTKLPSITYLDLSDDNIHKTDWLSKMTQLEELYYSPGSEAGNYDIIHVDISGLTNLKCLSFIEDSGDTDFNVSQLKKMKHLQKLELNTNYNPGLDKLKKMPQIKDLSVYLGEEYDNLNFLKNMGQLTALNLDISSDFPGADYTPLKSLINLKKLTILSESEDSNNITKVISKMKQLTSLVVETRMKSTDFLKGLQNLKTLALLTLGQEEAVDITSLADMQKLNTLDVSNIKIDDISVLGKSKSLSTLFYQSNNEPGNLEALTEAIPYMHVEEVIR